MSELQEYIRRKQEQRLANPDPGVGPEYCEHNPPNRDIGGRLCTCDCHHKVGPNGPFIMHCFPCC